MMKKIVLVFLMISAISLSFASCTDDKNDSSDKSVSAYVDNALKNSSQFAESRTMEEELYMRYSQADIDANKQKFLEEVFPNICDDMTDTDNDGLIDLLEQDAKTDINNPDTDGDGVDDFCEIYLLGSNPVVADE